MAGAVHGGTKAASPGPAQGEELPGEPRGPPRNHSRVETVCVEEILSW